MQIKKRTTIRIKLFSNQHQILDSFLSDFINILKKKNINFSGPILLPNKIEKITLIKSVFAFKKSKEHFQKITHCRSVTLYPKVNEIFDISHITLPSTIDLELKRIH